MTYKKIITIMFIVFAAWCVFQTVQVLTAPHRMHLGKWQTAPVTVVRSTAVK